MFLLVARFWEVEPPALGYVAALPALVLAGIMLGALGLLLSSWIKQLENFAGVMNFVIFPMFFASSALYPLWRVKEASLPLYWACMANPFTHAVELVRFALYLRFDPISFAVVLLALLVFGALAVLGYDPRARHARPPGRRGVSAAAAAAARSAALVAAAGAGLGRRAVAGHGRGLALRPAVGAARSGRGALARPDPRERRMARGGRGRGAGRGAFRRARSPEEEGVAAIEGFAAPLDPASRRRLLPLAFAGALEETNRQRDALIEQIRRFARRQRGLAEGVRGLEAELRAMPADAGAARAELEQRHAFAAKSFTDAERTMRYACEAPVRLEARLGAYARALLAALPSD